MSYCYQADTLREAADILQDYVDLEDDLIKLAGFNLCTLIDKLKFGYKLEEPTQPAIGYAPDGAPHLVDITTSEYNLAIYELNVDVSWEDLNDYEKRLMYESLRDQLDMAYSEIDRLERKIKKPVKVKVKVKVRKKEEN